MNLHDTIAAISTPIGEGGIGIIRISGVKAKEIGLAVLRNSRGELMPDLEDHRLYYGQVVNPQDNTPLDEALFFYAGKPRSFTAEDTVEIQSHGGMLVLSKVLELVNKNGARLAGPGEFTQRAFLNGRIDLLQAESIIDLIRAKTEKAQQLALNQLTGRTSREIQRIESELYQVLISIEAILDFPEEGLPNIEKNRITQKVTAVYEQLCTLLTNFEEGRRLREGVSVVITGRPNVGKSSLLNAFLQEERAIVTEIPGTTRDIIEAQIQLSGIPFRLIDTAGMRETDHPIERIGIEKAEQYINDADLVLLMIDGSEPLSLDDRRVIFKLNDKKVLVIINKTDLPQQVNRDILTNICNSKVMEVSLVTGEGLEELQKEMMAMVGFGNIQVEDLPMLSKLRHKHALEEAVAGLSDFLTGLRTGISEDLLAVDLRACLGAIGEITGKNVSEEVINGIFTQFCIGK